MKIKTITCHEVYNYGASLQEYALIQFLESQTHQVETIHYKPHYLSNHFNLYAVSNPKFDKPFLKQLYLLAKLPSRIKDLKRKKAFDEFSLKYIKTNTTLYKTNEDLKKNVPDADLFICGSDQIWNSYFDNGKDPAFYLDFVPDNKLKIAYAASFAIESIEEALKPFVKQKVQRLDAIGVRETSGVKILEDMGVENAKQVLDPVFLLPKSHWEERFISSINEDFIFVYDFDSNPIIEKIAKKIADSYNCKIFTVNKNINYADCNYYLEGPEKYLSLMHAAKFVVTNSFHSVAFSIIFKKQVLVVNRSEKINTRMRDLLSLFDLKNNLVAEVPDFNNYKVINYEIINNSVNENIDKSKLFLIQSVNLKK